MQAFQEVGGLAGRVLLALLAAHILSRRKLLRLFQLPGLLVLPVIFALAAGSSGELPWQLEEPLRVEGRPDARNRRLGELEPAHEAPGRVVHVKDLEPCHSIGSESQFPTLTVGSRGAHPSLDHEQGWLGRTGLGRRGSESEGSPEQDLSTRLTTPPMQHLGPSREFPTSI